jgi:thiol-disulfide isomerase/thioredoxin
MRQLRGRVGALLGVAAVVLAIAGCAGSSTEAGGAAAGSESAGAPNLASAPSSALLSSSPSSPGRPSQPATDPTTSPAGSVPASPSPAGSSAGTEPASSAPSGASVAATVPEELRFTATTVGGASFDGASLAGRPAVLWFWAPWCPNCRAEAPQVAAAAAAHPGVTFVGVAAQDDIGPMQEFVADYGLGGFEHVADLDAAVWARFGVTYQPAYAFVRPDGSIDVVKARVSAEELSARVSSLAG